MEAANRDTAAVHLRLFRKVLGSYSFSSTAQIKGQWHNQQRWRSSLTPTSAQNWTGMLHETKTEAASGMKRPKETQPFNRREEPVLGL
jgi:hypothetical protein